MIRRSLLSFALAALAALWAVAPASASLGLSEFDVFFSDSEGAAVTQAGSHPYELEVSFSLNTKAGHKPGGILVDEALKDLELTQIPGFIGNPTAVPPCATSDFLTTVQIEEGGGKSNVPSCPNSAAVGFVEVETLSSETNLHIPLFSPVYNLQPSPGQPAKLGFWTAGVPVTVDLGVSDAFPFNIVGGPRNVSQIVEVISARFRLWGVPGAEAHDTLRGHCLSGSAVNPGVDNSPKTLGKCPAGVSEKPFLTMPRACNGPLETKYEADSWANPGLNVKGSVSTHDASGNPRGMSGCGKLGFGPQTTALPSTEQAESSSGLDFSLDVTDEGLANPEGLAQADIEDLTLALPKGVTLNPSAAEGLGVCTKAQYDAESLEVHGCPEAAKLGSIEADTPILENHTLHGSLYLAQQDDPATTTPKAENPFDSLFALYLVIRDPGLGVFIKLPAKVEPDPLTGQIITTIEDLPPFPLGHVITHLRSGPRAPLITPPTCGTYTTTATLTPSSGAAPLPTTSTFKINSGPGGGPCPAAGVAPFAPGFEAGSLNNAAGAYSPFLMRITRADGEQDLTRFSAVLPPGVIAKIAGLGRCPDAAIAAAKQKSGRQEQASPSCPANSQVGHVIGGAGVGSALTYVPGSLYLAGPYNGAPLSVVAIVPAVAGPFDAGTVVTRVALKLNPETFRAEVDGAASDPIPHILKGIPLKVRELRVYADRPDFTINPTNCSPFQSTATLFGSFADPFDPADDIAVPAASRYQAASCASLGFKPKLSLALKGGTHRSDHPALSSTLTYPQGPGYSNIAKAAVTLPPSVQIDNAHIENPCTRVQFNANACPPGSILGTAKATTPLLDEPLEGFVYFRANGGERLLPDVVADLNGTFRVILVGAVTTATPKSTPRLRTTFATAPDAPVSKFTLNLYGGKRGLLVNNRNICAHKYRAKIALTGQNGRPYDTEPLVGTSCKAKAGKGSGHSSKRRR